MQSYRMAIQNTPQKKYVQTVIKKNKKQKKKTLYFTECTVLSMDIANLLLKALKL